MLPPHPPTPPHASEATRLLCAGTYLDSGYRDRVIEQLHLHEQRIVAPSLGFDAARVLAHALRARRQELLWAGLIVGLWVVGLPLTGGLLAGFLVPSLLLAVASWVRGKEAQPPLYRRLPAFMFRWWGRILFTMFLITTVVAAFGGGDEESYSSSYYSSYGDSYYVGDSSTWTDLLAPDFSEAGGILEPWQAGLTLGVFALIALCVAGQRGQFAKVLAAELSPQRFPDAADDPAEQAEGQRFQRLKERIRVEQHAPLIMYHEKRPFWGRRAVGRHEPAAPCRRSPPPTPPTAARMANAGCRCTRWRRGHRRSPSSCSCPTRPRRPPASRNWTSRPSTTASCRAPGWSIWPTPSGASPMSAPGMSTTSVSSPRTARSTRSPRTASTPTAARTSSSS
ncbi:hypothetical protein AB0I98_06520 [Streptomyces sp. NPDC050211]|uniref:hypothetical protein n=1 Tax=Streptomyces sp. NPDC050211 TaxID=3154932 RepID=UPI0034229546